MRRIQIICALILLITTGCSAENKNNEVTAQEPESSITSTDNAGNETSDPGVSIVRTDNYENLEISDWLDSDTVIVSKENESLGKMTLEELADSYPRSLYLYDLKTKEYKLLKEQEELNLGGAKLSPDKKNLLYHGYSLGDQSYHVLNMESLEGFDISGEPIGSAGSAKWADKDTIIGAGYVNGAYYATADGHIASFEELDPKAVFIIEKIKDTVYYNTADDMTLMALNQSDKETVNLGLTNISGVYPSPAGDQMLVLQYNGSKQILLLCDMDGKNVKTIAEGIELGGISWSPDQRMIAYSVMGEESSTGAGILYIYDMLTDESVQAAADAGAVVTCWSPSGEELVYSQWDGKQYHSSIVYLEYSLKK
ncbi:MAG: hypothetical protein QM657_03165 [Lacrimispora sp.]|uniref:eIF2A-related protein n=1 Tax=Lacrimispora sp. TaxID=2719234 RepID=UPI0039E6164D